MQDKLNKQGSISGIDIENAKGFILDIKDEYEHAGKTYKRLLEHGVAREIARLVIPISQYSKMRASANLLNWLRFLKLRMASNAQYEIRQYANEVAVLLNKYFPRTMQLFSNEIQAN